MAEMVLRKNHKRVDRWMPREKRPFTRLHMADLLRFAARVAPAYLLSFAELLGIPSGMAAACTTAMAVTGQDARPGCLGIALAVGVRAISGYPPRWELLITAAALLVMAPFLMPGRKNPTLMLCTSLSLVPAAIAASLLPTVAQMVQGWAGILIGSLIAPVFARALLAASSRRSITSLEERLSVGCLLLMVLCGAARMMLLNVNLGVTGASVLVIAAAMVIGPGAGALLGMLAGVALALSGLPMMVSIALSMGGFLAGVVQSAEKRAWSCAGFACGAYLPLLLTSTTGVGVGMGVLSASLVMMVLPASWVEVLLIQARRFLPDSPAPGDAYAAAALAAWEQTIAAMARAVPSPRDHQPTRNAAWWESHLCDGCPQRAECGCMATELAAQRAEDVWQRRTAPEAMWQDALEGLRGLGCARLYHLLDAMNALRREDEQERRALRQADAQRDMLITHLTAMSGAARRFAACSGGGSWWEERSTRRITHLLDESATPARLCYVRQVQGHVRAAYELHHITAARQQAESLCDLTAAAVGSGMQVAAIDGDRCILAERPPFQAAVEIACAAITGQAGNTPCGDTAFSGLIADGRHLVTLSDGMGHGDAAALISRQAVELLRLCMDAGYTTHQALTAVNGMLLMGGAGERFATADMLLIDLWTARATLDKLGTAATWHCREGALTRLTGDALPLGILESIDSRTHMLPLAPGDVLILLTDGVEDAFRSVTALEAAILAALEEDDAADALLSMAFDADDGQRRDDQSAVVVRLTAVES